MRLNDDSSWRDSRFRRFALGNGVNSIGESMYALAIPLLTFQITGSLTAMAVLATVYPVVITLSGPLIGLGVDRFGAGTFMLGGLCLQVAAALTLNVVLLAGPPAIWVLILAESVVQFGAITYRAGWMAGLPLMLPDNTSRARGAMLTVYQASVVIGPALAAALVSPLGTSGLLWFNLVTFFAPIYVWASGVRPVKQEIDPSPGWHPIRELNEGWQAVKASGRVPLVLLVLVPQNFVFSTGTISLILFYFRDEAGFSASVVSLIVMACNISALCAALFTSERSRLPIGVVAQYGLVGIGLCLIGLMVSNFLLFAVLAAVALYALDSSVEVAAEMVLYEDIPVRSIGRVLGLFRLIRGVPTIASSLAIAAASEIGGARSALALLGVAALGPGAWLLFTRGRSLTVAVLPNPRTRGVDIDPTG